MRRHTLIGISGTVLFLLAGCAMFRPADPELHAENTARLEKLKKLEGAWQGTSRHGEEEKPVEVTYKVTAGDSAVMETIHPGTPMEMVTFYNMDGKDLLLTHYCMLGNQPKMQARKGGDGDTIQFDFVECGNLESPDASHMHTAKLEFVDENSLAAEWTMFKDGKAAGPAVFELKRVSD